MEYRARTEKDRNWKLRTMSEREREQDHHTYRKKGKIFHKKEQLHKK